MELGAAVRAWLQRDHPVKLAEADQRPGARVFTIHDLEDAFEAGAGHTEGSCTCACVNCSGCLGQ